MSEAGSFRERRAARKAALKKATDAAMDRLAGGREVKQARLDGRALAWESRLTRCCGEFLWEEDDEVWDVAITTRGFADSDKRSADLHGFTYFRAMVRDERYPRHHYTVTAVEVAPVPAPIRAEEKARTAEITIASEGSWLLALRSYSHSSLDNGPESLAVDELLNAIQELGLRPLHEARGQP